MTAPPSAAPREILFQPGTQFYVKAAERTTQGGSPYLHVHLVEL